MKVIISLPLPFDAWDFYRSYIRRFCDTFKQFPPCYDDYELWAMCNWGEPSDGVREWFYGMKTRFVPYYENGCDLGGHQVIAQQRDCFVVGMTSRCYFHRAGWLANMMSARAAYGPGLYGCSASRQGGRLHLCTRAFGLDSNLWRRYPHKIDARTKGPTFEVGDERQNIMEFVNTKAKTFVVHWDNSFKIPDEVERYFASPGRFRDGNQNAMLVHDYHTDQYRDANEEGKSVLSQMMTSPKNSV